MNNPVSKQSAIEVTEQNFGAEVLRCPRPVLVEFWTRWSGPCETLDPVLTEMATSPSAKAKVVRVNADDCLDLSLLYEIQSVPTLLYFIRGQPRLKIIGAASKEAILAKLEPLGLEV